MGILARRNKQVQVHPLNFAWHIGNQLMQAGAHIDMVLDLPLTTTIRFTMKKDVFRKSVDPVIAWNIGSDVQGKLGQIIKSEPLTNEIMSYEIQFIKYEFEDEVKQLAS